MNLLRLELKKILPYRSFWIILGTYAVLIFLFVYSSQRMDINNSKLGSTLFQFPDIWNNLTYIGNIFNILLGVLIIVLISDEYSFRTLRQQVIDGLSRMELVLAKFYIVLTVAAVSTLFLLAVGLFFGFMYSYDTSTSAVTSQLGHLFYYFVQTIGIMSLAMLFSFIIKKSGLSIIAFLAYVMIIEPLLHTMVPDHIFNFFPSKVLSSLTPNPLQGMLNQATTPADILSPAMALAPALIYTGLFLLVSYLILKLRDL